MTLSTSFVLLCTPFHKKLLMTSYATELTQQASASTERQLQFRSLNCCTSRGSSSSRSLSVRRFGQACTICVNRNRPLMPRTISYCSSCDRRHKDIRRSYSEWAHVSSSASLTSDWDATWVHMDDRRGTLDVVISILGGIDVRALSTNSAVCFDYIWRFKAPCSCDMVFLLAIHFRKCALLLCNIRFDNLTRQKEIDNKICYQFPFNADSWSPPIIIYTCTTFKKKSCRWIRIR